MDNNLKKVFEKKGLREPTSTDSMDSVLPLIELIRKDGAIFIFKVDGERDPVAGERPYTVMASGKNIPEGIVRCDSFDLMDGIKTVLLLYSEKVWFKR